MLINVARGPVVAERDLFEALTAGTIAGAVLDVWWRYPTADEPRRRGSEFAFHELDNVLMTPHSSGWTEQMMDRRWDMIVANLRALCARRAAAQRRQAGGSRLTGQANAPGRSAPQFQHWSKGPSTSSVQRGQCQRRCGRFCRSRSTPRARVEVVVVHDPDLRQRLVDRDLARDAAGELALHRHVEARTAQLRGPQVGERAVGRLDEPLHVAMLNPRRRRVGAAVRRHGSRLSGRSQADRPEGNPGGRRAGAACDFRHYAASHSNVAIRRRSA